MRNRQVTMPWFYDRSVEDIRCAVQVSVFSIKMFQGKKHAELIIILEADNKVFPVNTK